MTITDRSYYPLPTDDDKRIGAMLKTAMRLISMDMPHKASDVVAQLERIEATSFNPGQRSSASAALRAIRHFSAIKEGKTQ